VAGYANCNTTAPDCETPINTAQNCGGCGVACSGATPVCQNSGGVYRCVSDCTASAPTKCGAQCVNTMTDANHCGGCDRSCNLPNTSVAICAGGSCAAQTCSNNFGDCTAAPGCETSLASVQNCGRCGNVCPVPTNAQATCGASQCDFSCIAPKVRCGNACYECCNDGDCKAGTDEQAACRNDHTCLFTCKSGTTRCGAKCLPPTVIGACYITPETGLPSLRWCDSDVGERYFLTVVSREKAIQDGWDVNDPDVLTKICLNDSDDLTLGYCGDPRYPARQTRMDKVYVDTLKFDADGKTERIQTVPGARMRICAPP
jgi:hypothetical protein